MSQPRGSLHDESIGSYRVLVEKEGRQELRDDLARAMMSRGIALRKMGRLEEAVAAFDESISIHRVLVEGEGRLELRNDLARALCNLALVREKQGLPTALGAAREARLLRQEMVDEGMKYVEEDLAYAKALEARLS